MNKSLAKALVVSAALGLAAQANAAGFEKSIMFGGKTSGIAGIGTPQVQGSEALYFNPAGLATDKEGKDVSLNLSPTFAKFKAPVATSNVTMESKQSMALPFSLMYQHSVSSKLGLGAGVYSSGGTDAEYENVTLSGGNKGNPIAKSKLQVVELGLGAGYQINEAWKVGLTYRIISVKGEFGFMQPYPPSYVANTLFKDVSATSFTSFKVGAQYKMSENTKLGFTYRSNSPFSAKAKATLNVHNPATVTTAANDVDVKLKSTLPDAYTLGVMHTLSDKWSMFGELVYTTYGRIKNVQIEGKIATSTNPVVQLDWKDQINVRLAGEYTGMAAPLRFGYIYTSQVTDPQFAKPTFTPPAVAHTLTVGSGMNLAEAMSLNGGVEYTWAKGSSGSSPAAIGTKLGDYSVSQVALHLGIDYTF